jgi:hypothetical protein
MRRVAADALTMHAQCTLDALSTHAARLSMHDAGHRTPQPNHPLSTLDRPSTAVPSSPVLVCPNRSRPLERRFACYQVVTCHTPQKRKDREQAPAGLPVFSPKCAATALFAHGGAYLVLSRVVAVPISRAIDSLAAKPNKSRCCGLRFTPYRDRLAALRTKSFTPSLCRPPE